MELLREKLELTLEATELWISRIARWTDAGWIVIYDVALGVWTAVARVNTQIVRASRVARAIAIRGTLGYNFSCKQIVASSII